MFGYSMQSRACMAVRIRATRRCTRGQNLYKLCSISNLAVGVICSLLSPEPMNSLTVPCMLSLAVYSLIITLIKCLYSAMKTYVDSEASNKWQLLYIHKQTLQGKFNIMKLRV
jgi:hypothetical protein